jgi:hypothetical protein
LGALAFINENTCLVLLMLSMMDRFGREQPAPSSHMASSIVILQIHRVAYNLSKLDIIASNMGHNYKRLFYLFGNSLLIHKSKRLVEITPSRKHNHKCYVLVTGTWGKFLVTKFKFGGSIGTS